MESINEKEPIVIIGQTADGRSNKYRFLSSSGDYVTISKLKKLLELDGKSLEDWYDENINTEDDLTCPYCKIKKRSFCDVHRGYYKSCSNKECYSRSITEANIKRYENPEERRKTSAKMKEVCGTPEARERNSKAQLKSYAENPDRAKELSVIQLKRYENPAEHIKTSEAVRKGQDKPGVRERMSLSQSLSYMNPTESRLNSLGPRGISYFRYSKWESKNIKFDSSWELKFFQSCLRNKLVDKLVRCPFGIRFVNSNNQERTYLPDFLLNGHYLIEIKPNYLIDCQDVQDKMKAAIRYCSDHNLSYVIITEDYLFHNGSPYYGSLPFKLNDYATTDD